MALPKAEGEQLLKQVGKLVKKLAKTEGVLNIEVPNMLTLVDDDADEKKEFLQLPLSVKKQCQVKCGSKAVDLSDVLSSTSVSANIAVGISDPQPLSGSTRTWTITPRGRRK